MEVPRTRPRLHVIELADPVRDANKVNEFLESIAPRAVHQGVVFVNADRLNEDESGLGIRLNTLYAMITYEEVIAVDKVDQFGNVLETRSPSGLQLLPGSA